MKPTAPSPITAESDLITFTVKSNGSPIKDTYQVISIYVERSVNKIPYCEIEIADGSVSKAGFPISDSDTFVPGNKIEVLAGYENKNSTIFKGVVLQHNIQISDSEGPVLRILCLDEAVKMTVGRKNAYFKDKTDSAIISELIADNGLSADVTATADSKEEMIQYYSTDWDFMVTRADANGLVALVEDGKVNVNKPQDAKGVVLGLTYGNDIFEFDAVLDAQPQYKLVKSSAWNSKTQEVISREATPTNQDIGNITTSTLSEVIGLESFDLQSVAAVSSDRLQNWAQANATKSSFSKIRGTVKFQGSSLALPGTLIGLKGVGKRFEGNAYVSGVIHDIKEGNWITTAKLGLSPEWYTPQVRSEAPLAAGLLPGTQGLQVGKVKQVNEDPDGEFRVLITLPLIPSGDDGVWARLSTFYATAGAGAFFYPEVDDEVIVGFLDDDPRYPVILGSVYSSKRAASDTPDENNSTKAFVSRSKMKITFDEEKKEITIITPANNQLVFSDEEAGITMKDENGNFIQLSSDGIEINSASDVRISAAESIMIDGPSGITETASEGTISLTALQISASADTELSLSADASSSLSSSGELSITGAMVLINS